MLRATVPDDVVAALRQQKHRLAMAVRPFRRRLLDVMYPRIDTITRWEWRPWMAPGSEQHGCRAHGGYRGEDVPRRIFVFWTGRNEMPPNRRRAFQELKRIHEGVDVIVVGPDNLGEWIVPGFELHPAYEYLSCVHRADYLRCYFMHFHGGGYSDVKIPLNNWAPVFTRLDAHPESFGVGYQEIGWWATGEPGGAMGRLVRRHYSSLVGTCGFIMRPGTDFTGHWLESVNRALDGWYDEVRSHPGGIYGECDGYPVPWTGILANVFHPWNLVYSRRFLHDERLVMNWDQSTYHGGA